MIINRNLLAMGSAGLEEDSHKPATPRNAEPASGFRSLGEIRSGAQSSPNHLRSDRRLRSDDGHFHFSADARIEGMIAMFEALDMAVMLADRFGRVVLANGKAEALIRDPLFVVKGELALVNAAEQFQLKAQLASALAGQGDGGRGFSGTVIISREGRRPLLLRVISLPKSMLHSFTPASAIIVITDPEDRPAIPEDVLRRLFGLTPTEASVASSLATGKSISEYASERELTVGTARQLMKQVLAKTETHRQSALVALIKSYETALRGREP